MSEYYSSASVTAALERTIELDEAALESKVVEEPLPRFPEFTGSLVALSNALAPDLPFCHKFMVALTLIGGLLSGHVHIAGSPHIDPRLYACLIDEKGAGKSGSCNEVRRTLSDLLSGEVHSCPSIDSGAALVMELKQHPKTFLFADELPALFEKAKSTGGSRNTLFTELMTLYDGHETGNTAKNNLALPRPVRKTVCEEDSASIVVDNAHFFLTGCAQRQTFQAMWQGTRAGASGLQSRFVLASSGQESVPEPQTPTDDARALEAVSAITDQVLPYINSDEPQFIQMPEDQSQRLRDWWTERHSANEQMSPRLPAILMRVLMILAVTNDTTTITPELMDQALAFGEYQIEMASQFMPPDAMTWDQAFADLIKQAFLKHGASGLTFRQVRQYVNPEKHKLLGGYGPFLKGWRTLLDAQVVRAMDKTRSKTDIYTYDPNG